MSEQMNRDQLDDVLEAYMVAVPVPTHDALAAWVAQYPQFAAELTAYTVARLTTPMGGVEIPDAASFQRDLEVVRGVLAGLRPTPALPGILAAGKQAGMANLAAIAARTRLSAAIVRKLDFRLMDVRTLPEQLLGLLGQVLGVSPDAVRQYLLGAPVVPQGSSFRSEQAPAVSAPEDFFEAVRTDLALTDEDRQYWLSFKP